MNPHPTLDAASPHKQLLCEAALRLAAASQTVQDEVQRGLLAAMARLLIDMTEAK